MSATKAAVGPVLSIPQAAEELGGCSRQHVYNLIRDGLLPTVNIALRKNGPTKKRIPVAAIEEFKAKRTNCAPRRRTRSAA